MTDTKERETDGQIGVEWSGRQGKYLLPLPDAEPAWLSLVQTSPGTVAIDYSWVPPAYRGRGVALKLIRKAVGDARAQGFRITPLCGYVASEFRRHPDWHDVLAARN